MVAKKVADELGADLLDLKVVEDYPEGAPKLFFWGGKIVRLKPEPDLLPYSFDASQYDLIILGTPVWIGTYAPPIETFLRDNAIGTQKLALIACHGGGGFARTQKKLQKRLPNNPIIATLGLDDPLDATDKTMVMNNIYAFCDEIKANF